MRESETTKGKRREAAVELVILAFELCFSLVKKKKQKDLPKQEKFHVMHFSVQRNGEIICVIFLFNEMNLYCLLMPGQFCITE